MSIATETQRLIQAKTDLKASIEKRGADIPTDSTIDTYANMLEACPYGISGTFVPEEDTNTFSLSGLLFTPTSIMMVCSQEIINNSRLSENVMSVSTSKGVNGIMLYTNSTGGTVIATIRQTSAVIQWDENGVNINLPSSVAIYFKKGLIFNYYVTGGNE